MLLCPKNMRIISPFFFVLLIIFVIISDERLTLIVVMMRVLFASGTGVAFRSLSTRSSTRPLFESQIPICDASPDNDSDQPSISRRIAFWPPAFPDVIFDGDRQSRDWEMYLTDRVDESSRTPAVGSFSHRWATGSVKKMWKTVCSKSPIRRSEITTTLL